MNPCNQHVYAEENAIVFCAKDAAVIAMLKEYKRACKTLGSNPEHIKSINLLTERVRDYQIHRGDRVADTVGDCEIDRCVGGIV